MSRSFDPSSPTEPNDAIPSKLTDGFAELYPAPRVPATLDSAILNAARAHLAGRMHGSRSGRLATNRRLLRWAGAGAAAAAAVAAVVLIAAWPRTPAGAPRTALAGDINGDGRVDILDAYVVAKALTDKSRASPLPAAWDVNQDGVVDQKDVDWIANAAVRVGNGAVTGSDSKLTKSVDVFELADDMKSFENHDRRANVALLIPPTIPGGSEKQINAHGACTVGPAPQTPSTHGASTVGVSGPSAAPQVSQVDPAKGAVVQ